MRVIRIEVDGETCTISVARHENAFEIHVKSKEGWEETFHEQSLEHICEGLISVFEPKAGEPAAQARDERETLWGKLDKPISDIHIGHSYHGFYILKNAGIKYVGQIVAKSREEVRDFKDMGDKTWESLLSSLKEMGLEFGMDTMGWVSPEKRKVA